MTSSVYSAGTVTVTNGSAVVIGTGTAWAAALVTGGMLSFAGLSIPIASVESDTSLTLAYPWLGTTAAGAYAIARETSEAVRAAWISDRLAQILTKLSLAGIHPDGAGTLAERDALNPPPPAGYLWLRVETGFDLVFYKRTASGWDGPFSVRGGTGNQGPVGPQGLQGVVGPQGPVGPAYESYGVSVYKAGGIALGGYYADRRANGASTQAKLYAEILAGDVGSQVDFYFEIDGAMAAGPWTSVMGSPVNLTALSIAVPEGARVGFVVARMSGNVTDFFAKSYGALA